MSFEALGPVSFAPRPPVVPRLGGVPGPARPVVPSPPAVSSFSASLASALAAASPGAAASTGPMTPATGVAAPPATGVAGPSTTAAAVPATAAGAIAAPSAGAAPGSYPNLTGDLDASPEVLTRLDRMAAARGERWTVTSGLRTDAEQAVLWANRASNPYPVARPGTSIHRTGQGADVTIGGRPIQDVIPADALRAAGLEPLVGDAVHVQLAGTLN